MPTVPVQAAQIAASSLEGWHMFIIITMMSIIGTLVVIVGFLFRSWMQRQEKSTDRLFRLLEENMEKMSNSVSRLYEKNEINQRAIELRLVSVRTKDDCDKIHSRLESTQ